MRVRTVVVTALLALAAAATPAAAAPKPAPNQVYYTVTASYRGSPETLYEVAARYLGDPGRAGEILDLNPGRITDPGKLQAGSTLILPYDAAGPELQYGPAPGDTDRTSSCDWAGAPETAAWGRTMLAPDKAWPTADGTGVRIAVLGSGVDGAAPGLTGRVLTGTDVTTGKGRGDTGCSDGTGLAGIAAGDDQRYGIAPGAQVLPIRTGAGRASARAVATGLRVAAQAGATVVLIGAEVDAADPAVQAAITEAVAHDAVVVLAAPALARPAGGVLRVGAAGPDRRPAGTYPDGTVDVLAPGRGVATVGGAVNGPRYAAAFVAGTAALVRSAHPGLRAAEVADRVRTTASGGLADPAAAVDTPLPAGAGVNAVADVPASGMRTLSRALIVVTVAVAVVLLGLLSMRRVRPAVAGLRSAARSRRMARETRARMAGDGDDPFWDPPAAAEAPTGARADT